MLLGHPALQFHEIMKHFRGISAHTRRSNISVVPETARPHSVSPIVGVGYCDTIGPCKITMYPCGLILYFDLGFPRCCLHVMPILPDLKLPKDADIETMVVYRHPEEAGLNSNWHG